MNHIPSCITGKPYNKLHEITKVACTALALHWAAAVTPAEAALLFEEDFSTGWTNNVDGNLGTGASRNGWAIRDAQTYFYEAIGNPSPGVRQSGGPANWHYATKTHGLDTDVPGYRLSIDIQLDTNFAYGQGLLGNANGNGYYVRYAMVSSRGGALLSVYETSGSTANLYSLGIPNFTETLLGDNVFAGYSTTAPFRRLNMDLRQATPGGAFTITAWVDGFGSEEAPLLTFTDIHNGGLNLADLSSVAFTAKGGDAAGSNIQLIDNVTAAVVPEPGTASLLLIGAGGIWFLRRFRRQG